MLATGLGPPQETATNDFRGEPSLSFDPVLGSSPLKQVVSALGARTTSLKPLVFDSLISIPPNTSASGSTSRLLSSAEPPRIRRCRIHSSHNEFKRSIPIEIERCDPIITLIAPRTGSAWG